MGYLKIVWSLVSAAVFAFFCIFCILCLADPYVRYLRHLHQLPDHDYLAEIKQMRKEGRILEAITTSKAVLALPNITYRKDLQFQLASMQSEYDTWLRKTSDFTYGFVTGEGESTSSLAGKTISDFLVLGDIRDLGLEGSKEITSGNGDWFLMGLSTVGVLAFASAPHSGGTSLIFKTAINRFKALRKLGALSSKLAQSLLDLMKKTARTGDARRLSKLNVTVKKIFYSAPEGALPDLLKHCDSIEDMQSLARALSRYPNKAALFVRIGGSSSIDLLRKSNLLELKRWINLSIKKKVPIALKVRGGKLVYRRSEEARRAILRALTESSYLYLIVALAAALSAVLSAFRLRYFFVSMRRST